MKKLRNLIGPKLRKLRSQKNLSQSELAARCQRIGWDVSRDMIAAMEGQVRCVTEIELVGLAIAFQVSATELLSEKRAVLEALSS